MHIHSFKIRTNQVTIHTTARDEQAAKELIMKLELCPESAILNVERLNTPLKL